MFSSFLNVASHLASKKDLGRLKRRKSREWIYLPPAANDARGWHAASRLQTWLPFAGSAAPQCWKGYRPPTGAVQGEWWAEPPEEGIGSPA